MADPPITLPSLPDNFITIEDLSGGRNGTDNPITLSANEVVEARNVDWWRTTVGRKRGGAAVPALTGATFTQSIDELARHVPNAQDQNAELWGIDRGGIINRLAGGTAWTVPAQIDAFNGIALATQQASIGNKNFISNLFGTDQFGNLRQHVWDPTANNGVGLLRRTGINPSQTSPHVGDSGSGSYAAVQRWYRIRWIEERFIASGANKFSFGNQPSLSTVSTPITVTLGANVYVQTFDSGGALTSTTLTPSSNLNVLIYASSGGGGASGANTAVAGTATVTYLAVGGGGGGGNYNGVGGGGGGGGLLAGADTLGPGAYAVTVGAGGASQANGGRSTFNGHTAIGGGYGGTQAGTAAGASGGSGGGGEGTDGSFNPEPGGAGSQGNAGGAGASDPPPQVHQAGGGGGGAGGAGADAVWQTSPDKAFGGNGGAGSTSSISGSSVTYAGGGAGAGTDGAGSGGSGGGGAAAGNGTNALGGGGGGGGGNGGSGTVILSYATAAMSAVGGTVTTHGANTIHTFTSAGTWTITQPGGAGGAGGGGACANTTGMPFTLLGGNTYTLIVGAGGLGAVANAANGGFTSLANSSANLFYFSGGTGAFCNSTATFGAGGANTVGIGVTGGHGGLAGTTSANGANGTFSAGGTGGGGGGGWGGDDVATTAAYGGNGGNGSAGAAPVVPMGGAGGIGGSVVITSAAGIPQSVGAGGGGAGGNQVKTGANGQPGWCTIAFTSQNYVQTVGGFNSNTSVAPVWTANAVGLNVLSLVVVGQEVLIDGNTYTVSAVNSTTFSAAPNTTVTYNNAPVQVQSALPYLRSEPSPAITWTPNGTAIGVSVITPPRPMDTETHWELEASLDGDNYSRIATYPLAFGTTTYPAIDSVVAANYPNQNLYALSDPAGDYTVQKPYRFIAGDQNRTLGFGSYDATDPQSRLEWSDVLGSLNVGDVERVPFGNYKDFDEDSGGDCTGLDGPILGSFFLFKLNQVWQLQPTTSVTQPWSYTKLSDTIGALPNTIVCAADEAGNPAIYWLSLYTAWRYGVGGLQRIGHGIEDCLVGPTATLAFTRSTDTPATHLFYHHAFYYQKKNQIWFYVMVGDGVYLKLCYQIGQLAGPSPSDHPIASGWSIHDGGSGQARSGVQFSDVIGAAMSHTLAPYVGLVANNSLLVCDTTDQTDAGVPVQAYLITRPYGGKSTEPYGPGTATFGAGSITSKLSVNRAYVVAQPSAASLSLTLVGDSNLVSTTSSVSLAPAANETRVLAKFPDSGLMDVSTVQVQIGDASPVASAWSLDAVAIEVLSKETA